MKNNNINELTNEILNEGEIRAKLRGRVPLIGRLERLEDIKNLSMISLNAGVDKILMVDYSGIASLDLYPNIRANLIRKGVIKNHNWLNSGIENKGQYDEYKELALGVLGNMIQVRLKLYNPHYNISK
ncbi:MAG: hypothetical protein Q7S27_00605 [Nanoarchaeota archaeon]|nr:hypothetical protein [Nanoarchaeota archaeon]